VAEKRVGWLRREAVDFRLDARCTITGCLDELYGYEVARQGLMPWVDEAASDDEGTIVVGDAKQRSWPARW
jgi:hypothetical protein